jgi:CTP synthase (UTP-ammonia lyase)
MVVLIESVSMKPAIRIGIVADYNPKNKYHVATEQSIAHAAEALGIEAQSIWVDTEKLDGNDAETRLAGFNGIWLGTSSPYRSMAGALLAVRFARERGVPFVGT